MLYCYVAIFFASNVQDADGSVSTALAFFDSKNHCKKSWRHKISELLLENGNISDDVSVMLYEMYLYKHGGGENFDSDKIGKLYKEFVCFIIVGLKINVSNVVQAFHKRNIVSDWVKKELLEYLDDEYGCPCSTPEASICINQRKYSTVRAVND